MTDKEFKKYAELSCSSRRLADDNDYWKFSDSRINDKAPQYKGECMIVHGEPGSGKTTLLQKMIKDVPAGILKIVVVFGTRGNEHFSWQELADRVFCLSASRELAVGAKGMWDGFLSAYMECLRETFMNHRDVLLVVDSCSALIPVVQRSGITPDGITLPGGIDQNAADVVLPLLSLHGIFKDMGSLTIWGTCLMQNYEEAYEKGVSPILHSVATSDIVLRKLGVISDLSGTNWNYVADAKGRT